MRYDARMKTPPDLAGGGYPDRFTVAARPGWKERFQAVCRAEDITESEGLRLAIRRFMESGERQMRRTAATKKKRAAKQTAKP